MLGSEGLMLVCSGTAERDLGISSSVPLAPRRRAARLLGFVGGRGE